MADEYIICYLSQLTRTRLYRRFGKFVCCKMAVFRDHPVHIYVLCLNINFLFLGSLDQLFGHCII